MKYTALFLSLVVSGCAVHNTEKLFVGVPVFAGLEGSTARLDENWVVTSAHNRAILILQFKDDVVYHPHCDIALVPSQGSNTTRVGTAYIGDTVSHVGYPMATPLTVNHGRIVGNINMTDYPECTMVATTGVVKSGMSGGGVYNKEGELIGINQGRINGTAAWSNGTKLTNGGVYMHLKTVRGWIHEVTGVDYFSDTDGLRDASE